MDFQDWMDAVNQSLKASGAGYTAFQIDPSDLQTAFHQGISPVLYARQGGHPMKAAPTPNGLAPMMIERATYIVRALDWAGWLLHLIGGGLAAFGAYGMITAIYLVRRSDEKPRDTPSPTTNGEVFGNMAAVYGFSATLLTGIMVIVFGVICWWLSGMFRATYKPS
ncbi:MAG: hypothetical protein ACK5QX_11395 [bacterium]